MALNYTLLAETPAGTPPPGITANFSDPYSLGYYNVITSAICVSVSTIVLWAKLYTKVFVSRNQGWEDYTIGLAWAIYMSFVGVGLIVTNKGAGTHQWDLYLLPVIQLSYYSNINQVTYAASICLVKVSILIQLLKLFFPGSRTFLFYALRLLIVFNVLLYIAIGVMEIFQCHPREKIWNPLIPGSCVDVRASFIFTASVNLVSDIMLLVLPIYFVLQLQMSLNRKIGISAIFASGLFACISTLVRLIYSVKLLHTTDTTWLMLPLGLWCHAEVTSGILAACLPSIPRLFQHIRGIGTGTQASHYIPDTQKGLSGGRGKSSGGKPSLFSGEHEYSSSRSKTMSNDWIPLKP